jgi:hypothetical protein
MCFEALVAVDPSKAGISAFDANGWTWTMSRNILCSSLSFYDCPDMFDKPLAALSVTEHT